MNIKQLQYFISAAEYSNFSIAAKNLNITQPALSKQIADLESQVGLKLFDRNTRWVKLTAAGAEFLKESIALINETESAINYARLVDIGNIGSLSIGFLGPFEREELPSLVNNFHHEYPQASLSFTKLSWGSLTEALENGKIDVVFTMTQGLHDLPGISFQLSQNFYPLSVIVPDNHPLAHKSKLHISELADEPFIILSRSECPQAYEHMRHLCISNGFYPNIVASVPLLETLLVMVATGMGIAIQTKHVKSYAHPSLQFIDLEGCSFVNGYAVAWKTNNPNPLIPSFVKSLKDQKFLIS
ncbi:MAG: transcriptional regulator AlsR family [Firmicutes bacterium]|nr:transcriptional regulator AlsR family [Bacillota bacterium]